MKTVVGLALIFAIAYGLLRVLAWFGQCWERGTLLEPKGENGPAHHGASWEAWEAARSTIPCRDQWEDRDSPQFNPDGPPIVGSVGLDYMGRPCKMNDD